MMMGYIRRNKDLLQWCILVFIVMLIGLDISLENSTDSYVVDKHFTVQVQSGDTLWGIAAKNVSNKDDIRNLVLVIKKLNGLDNSVQIYPGQQLKIPLKKDPALNSQKYAIQDNINTAKY